MDVSPDVVSETILDLSPLATLSPSSNSRAWQSSPHPTLPIIATATSEKAVLIYSLTSFRLLNRITGGHKRSVRSVGWRRPLVKGSTASVLATGSFDSTVGIWRKEDDSPQSHDDEMEIRDKPTMAANDDDEEAWAFAVLLTGHDSEVKSVAFSPSNPSLLATSSRDKSVWIWEEVSGAADEDEYETIAVLTEHSGDVKCFAWNYEEDVLASGSYDDTIRLWREVEEEGDWMCIGCLEGHEGTVWSVQWEKPPTGEEGKWKSPSGLEQHQAEEWNDWSNRRGPRIASSSDDLTIRIWRREHRTGEPPRKALAKDKIPSIIRPQSTTETWIQESILPKVHSRSIYSLAWSERSGLIVSCGGDGSIFVYEEIANTSAPPSATTTASEHEGDVDTTMTTSESSSPPSHLQTTWRVIAQYDSAHGPYEINHVCWATRRDQKRRSEEEEVIISTGDGGDVKLWTLP